MSTPEGAGVDRYTCGTCGRRFADRPCFEGRHYAEDVILYAIRLDARNMLPKDAARTIQDEKKVAVSGRTIQRWVDEYPRMVAAFARDLEMTGGNAVSVDEKHYKPGGKPRWMARAMCMATRFILASDHWPDKLNHDATPLLKKVVERLGRRPLLLLSDKLGGYRKGYDSTMRTEPRPVTMHIPDAAVNNRHVNDNWHEHHNGDTERRKKGSRGFNSNVPGLFVLDEVYHHNSLRPHMGLGGMTPRREGRHYNTGARQATHRGTVRRGLPVQLCLMMMRPHARVYGACPGRHLDGVWPDQLRCLDASPHRGSVQRHFGATFKPIKTSVGDN